MQNEYRIALAGNPNTGKSTLFNLLTGLKQHTGNWAGKTVDMKVGNFSHKNIQYSLIDLPGTYSLFSNSVDEEVARNFIIFEKPEITLVVVDATSIERNLNLVLQVLEITDKVIVCMNLIDEAEKRGITINEHLLMNKLGVPVIKMSARNRVGIAQLLDTIDRLISGDISCSPAVLTYDEETEIKISQLEKEIKAVFAETFPARWLALRLLDGDMRLIDEVKKRSAVPIGGNGDELSEY
ncbi:FeoB small GTPase domain-containing protein [Neobacillus sp. LXY-4]|uniref:FeoB small GTPase domain-containing protein n=1 Tax=Neobacillus sp. LXY-4 TaxID=3379826 RepID=UPI003EDF5B71